ncbi:hypothetical protein GCM10020001_077530 [Nonomuraea salmonea]
MRRALGLGEHIPIVLCDVRRRDSVKDVLTTLVTYAVKGM